MYYYTPEKNDVTVVGRTLAVSRGCWKVGRKWQQDVGFTQQYHFLITETTKLNIAIISDEKGVLYGGEQDSSLDH